MFLNKNLSYVIIFIYRKFCTANKIKLYLNKTKNKFEELEKESLEKTINENFYLADPNEALIDQYLNKVILLGYIFVI